MGFMIQLLKGVDRDIHLHCSQEQLKQLGIWASSGSVSKYIFWDITESGKFIKS